MLHALRMMAHTELWAAMRFLPGYFIAVVLALLLTGTTPTGTGVGVHQLDLVHPLFAHVHVVNGQVLTHEQLERGAGVARPTVHRLRQGVAYSAGDGTSSTASGFGLTPTLSLFGLTLPANLPSESLGTEQTPPADRVEQPLDPPPTFSSEIVG
jgi:hypothetical protein